MATIDSGGAGDVKADGFTDEEIAEILGYETSDDDEDDGGTYKSDAVETVREETVEDDGSGETSADPDPSTETETATVNIDESRPYLDSVEIPSEARPGQRFNVEAVVGNKSTVLAPQTGTCQSGIAGTNVAWRNPVRVRVDGEVVHEGAVCADGSSPDKTERATLSLSPGSHEVRVEVLKVPDMTVADRVAGTVEVSEDARDPAAPTSGEQVTDFLGDLAEAVGTSAKWVVAGLALLVLVLVLVG